MWQLLCVIVLVYVTLLANGWKQQFARKVVLPKSVSRLQHGPATSSVSYGSKSSKLFGSIQTEKDKPSIWTSYKKVLSKTGSSLLVAGVVLFSSVLPTSAAVSTRQPAPPTPTTATTRNIVKEGIQSYSTNFDKQSKRVKVEVVVDKKRVASAAEQAAQRKRLNMVGLALVVGSILTYLGLNPMGDSGKKSKKSKDVDDIFSATPVTRMGKGGFSSGYFDDAFDDFGEKESAKTRLKKSRKTWEAGNEVSTLSARADAIFDEQSSKIPRPLKVQSGHSSSATSTTELDKQSSDELVHDSEPAEFFSIAKIVAAPEDSKLPASVADAVFKKPNPEVTAPPPPPAKKPGLLSRLFQRSGSGRPTSLQQAIEVQDESREFRLVVANALSRFLPQETLEGFEEFQSAMEVDVEEMDDDVVVDYAATVMVDVGLEPQQAANAFADVTNVFITHLIDKAGQFADDKDDKKAVPVLDELSEFVEKVGNVFMQLTPGVQIEPIQYNGRTKKGKLETLFAKYAKSAMDLKGMLGLGGMGQQGEDAVDRTERLGKLQFLFDIKEAKRNSIEQKIARDMMLGMTKELASGGGDLSSLFGGLGGGGGGGNMDQADAAKAFSELLGGAGGGDFGKFADIEGMPDLSKMSPEEAASAMKESMAGLREAIDQGELKKEDIVAIEEMLGMDVRQFAKLDRNQLRSMGAGMADFVDIFKKLADLKDRM